MSPPWVVFYAYKGGVGCTTALAHVAWVLAREGRRVVMLDLDLSAPGLAPLFAVPQDNSGFVDLALEWRRSRTCNVLGASQKLPLDERARGTLHLISAGRLGGEYLSFLQTLDWNEFTVPQRAPPHERTLDSPGGQSAFIERFQAEVTHQLAPDVVLIDTPTGFSETANVALRVLADGAAVFFVPNRLQLEGAGRVVGTLVHTWRERLEAGERGRPDVLCVASTWTTRGEDGAEGSRVQRALSYLRAVRLDALKGHGLSGEANARVLDQPLTTVGYEPSLACVEALDLRDAPGEREVAPYESMLRSLRELALLRDVPTTDGSSA